jgi:acyl carrier protein
MASDEQVRSQVREFITKNFYVPAGSQLADTTSLLDLGIVDSTGVLEVIGFLEKSFAIEVDDAEMVPDNLDSIAAIAAFVSRKRGG